MAINIDTSFDSDHSFMFISYSHRDEAFVEQVVEELKNRGCNLWMDKMIHAQEKWGDRIAEMVGQCSVMLCFISGSYLASEKFCMKEMAFAKNEGKEILPIFIESVELPMEWKMHFTDEQYIISDKKADPLKLAGEILGSEYVQACIIPASGDMPTEQIDVAAEPILLPKVRTAGAKMRVMQQRRKMKPLKRSWIKAAAIAAVLMLIFTVWISTRKVYITEHLKVNRRSGSVVISGEVIDSNIMGRLGKLKNLKSLQLDNCTIAATIAYLPELTQLNVSNSGSIENLQNWMKGLNNLTHLKVSGCGLKSNHLSWIPTSVTSLDLSGNKEISNVHSLAQHKLVSLNLSDTSVDSLGFLNGESIDTLDISGAPVESINTLRSWKNLRIFRANDTHIKSIDALAELENLVTLEVSSNGIVTPTATFQSLRLERLDLSNNAITDINAFSGCTTLQEVDLSGTKIEYIDLLLQNKASLTKLNLSDTTVDIAQLEKVMTECTQLTRLELDRVPIEILPRTNALKKLTYLSASGCGIIDFQCSLSNNPLRYLCLSNNYISNLSFMISFQPGGKMTLDLGYNPFRLLTYLPACEYDTLVLISDGLRADTLPASITGDTIVISAGSDLLDVEFTRGGFGQYYILDTPLNQRVQIEDTLGVYKVAFTDHSELPRIMKELGLDYSFLNSSADAA